MASLKDLAGIVVIQGGVPEKETIEKAFKEGIPILVSEKPMFEVAGRIYRLLTDG